MKSLMRLNLFLAHVIKPLLNRRKAKIQLTYITANFSFMNDKPVIIEMSLFTVFHIIR